jgi:hypothetical protein
MLPEKAAKGPRSLGRLQIFGTGKGHRMLKVVDRFPPAQAPTETDSLQSGLPDIEPDAFSHNRHGFGSTNVKL